MSPEKRLLFAIFIQLIQDYKKLDPDSDTASADFYESEGQDYKTAEDFIFGREKIHYGDLIFSFEDLVGVFQETTGYNKQQLLKRISEEAVEY